jgi:hypothetical protein
MLDDRIWVFAGPSLPVASRPASDRFRWLPPAVAGDALAALERAPRALVLIDGLFDHHPAIRHKELLSVMAHGIPVLGGASMGALRAAELYPCGMIGVGRIFEAYASGRLVGDDEVAVLHGPAGMGWACLTIPLVNVRATLMRAMRSRIIGAGAARTVRRCAATTFYQDRTWRHLLEAVRRMGEVPEAQLLDFDAWLPRGYVDLKHADALLCIAAAAALPRRSAINPSVKDQTVFTRTLASQVSRGLKPEFEPC